MFINRVQVSKYRENFGKKIREKLRIIILGSKLVREVKLRWMSIISSQA